MASASVVTTNNIAGNGRKKLLVIGKTGTGKSSLCNVISGQPHNASLFPASAGAEACTQHTVFADINFSNDAGRPVSLIDTIGFDDPTKDGDTQIIAEMVDKLKNECDHINLFVIAINGQNPRLDGSLVEMITTFEGMFSKQLWKQVVIVFTRMPMDSKNKRRRQEVSQQTDEDLANSYLKEVEAKFSEATDLKYLFLDACYDAADSDEKTHFDAGLQSLWKFLESAPNLPTTSVTKIEKENEALKQEIQRREQERKDALEAHRREVERLNAEIEKEKERVRNISIPEPARPRDPVRKIVGKIGRIRKRF